MRVLVCSDGSEQSDDAIDLVARLFANAREMEIQCVTAIEPAAGTELEMIIESAEDLTAPGNPAAVDAQRLLSTCEHRFGQHDVGPGVKFETKILAGPAARAICETAEEWNADLIVLGSHGRGFLGRSVLGSVSERVLHHSQCPVLIAR